MRAGFEAQVRQCWTSMTGIGEPFWRFITHNTSVVVSHQIIYWLCYPNTPNSSNTTDCANSSDSPHNLLYKTRFNFANQWQEMSRQEPNDVDMRITDQLSVIVVDTHIGLFCIRLSNYQHINCSHLFDDTLYSEISFDSHLAQSSRMQIHLK